MASKKIPRARAARRPARNSAPTQSRRKEAVPPPFPLQAEVADRAGARFWPWLAVALFLGGLAWLGLGSKEPGATVANNLPAGRKVNEGPATGAPPAAPTRPPINRPAGFAQARAGAPQAPRPEHWDRSNPRHPKITFQIMREEGGKAEVAIFRQPNVLVRSLSSESGPAGIVKVSWDGLDEAGKRVPTGAYFARLSGAGGDHIREINIK